MRADAAVPTGELLTGRVWQLWSSGLTERMAGDERLQRVAIEHVTLAQRSNEVLAIHEIDGDRWVLVTQMVHPVMAVDRRADGVLLDVADGEMAADEVTLESWMAFRVSQIGGADELRGACAAAMGRNKVCVEQWHSMRAMIEQRAAALERATPPVSAHDRSEALALARWLASENAIVFAVGELDENGAVVEVSGDSALLGTWTPLRNDPLVTVRRNAEPTPFPRDELVTVANFVLYDASDRPSGGWRVAFAFSDRGLRSSVFATPFWRRSAGFVWDAVGVRSDGHAGRSLRAVLEQIPRFELAEIAPADATRRALELMAAERSESVRCWTRNANGLTTVLLAVPGERWSGRCIEQLPALLHEMTPRAVVRDIEVQVLEGRPTMCAITMTDATAIDVTTLAKAVTVMVSTPIERITELTGLPEASMAQLDPDYLATTDVTMVASDMRRAAQLAIDEHHSELIAEDDCWRLRVIHRGTGRSSSTLVPLLDHLGCEVIEQRTSSLALDVVIVEVWVRPWNHEIDHDSSARLVDAFDDLWLGRSDADPLCRLVLAAGLTTRQVAIVRTYVRYLRQTTLGFSDNYVAGALEQHPELVRQLLALHDARLNPDSALDDAVLLVELDTAVAAVPSLDHDRIIRAVRDTIMATLRSTAFVVRANGTFSSTIAIKLDAAIVPHLPEPRPWREVWVHDPSFEAIHLRAGAVARGGLRWSDRPEDFRTEILGLMKAQKVKNAVIVPTGAKGGFVVRRPASDPAAFRAEGERCYRAFISAMLSLTDNRIGDSVVGPQQIRRRDSDDPYLVVAADKGTATFSDLANSVSAEFGFWLGDAFASGGSNGYDHKAMGITAKGAWESARRHGRVLGVDVDRDRFTCVGIGDMSGDVFGNGMLLSPSMALVAAFDHRHIFLDPTPDVAAAYTERQRMFVVPRSSWDDYNRSLISAGGGIWPRSVKSIPISAPVAATLGLAEGTIELAPVALINAMLRASVDMVFNGGIGTYVKATDESNSDAGDRANDALRVDAAQLRCKMLVEGGNLGMTQRGRIEAAAAGVLLQTDAFDNSAGVDCSDHEVNIKIALNSCGFTGTQAERSALLQAMTDEVGELVLVDNREQSLLLAIEQRVSADALDVHLRLMHALESSGRLDRAVEYLPSDRQVAERLASGRGLTAPELAVLCAYVKLSLTDDIGESPVVRDPWLFSLVSDDLPDALTAAGIDLSIHPLRNEMCATELSNAVVNHAGIATVFELHEQLGGSSAHIAATLHVADALCDGPAIRNALSDAERAGTISWSGVAASYAAHRTAVVELSRRLLGRRPSAVPSDLIAGVGADIALATDAYLGATGATGEHGAAPGYHDLWRAEGVPDSTCRALGTAHIAVAAVTIMDIARVSGRSVDDVAVVHAALGAQLGVADALTSVRSARRRDRWGAAADQAVLDEIEAGWEAATISALASAKRTTMPDRIIEVWTGSRRPRIERVSALIGDLRLLTPPDPSAWVVVLQALRSVST
jgi:glutamate dehydrogenase